MNLSHFEAQIIRANDNAVGLMNLAQSHGWTDEQTAEAWNSQLGAGADRTAQKVAEHRAWLVNAGLWSPAPVSGDYLMFGGKRYAITAL